MIKWLKSLLGFQPVNNIEVKTVCLEPIVDTSFNTTYSIDGIKGLYFERDGSSYAILAGPMKNRPFSMRALCLDETQMVKFGNDKDWFFPIKDFSVPHNPEQLKNILQEVHAYACQNKLVYIGCLGGLGRTGLVLACLLKLHGLHDPVQIVRKAYNPKAVETPAQLKFVEEFQI